MVTGMVYAVFVLVALVLGFMLGRRDAWLGDQMTLASALYRGKRIRAWIQVVERDMSMEWGTSPTECVDDVHQLIEDLEDLERKRRLHEQQREGAR